MIQHLGDEETSQEFEKPFKMNWKEAYHLGMSLFKDSFKRYSGRKEDVEIIDKALQ